MEVNFKLLDANYEIIETTKEELYKINEARGKEDRNYFPYGITLHYERKIYINSEVCHKEKVKTLIHELMHAWMYLTANAYQEDYNEEHICEMVSASNQIINDIVHDYFSEKEMIKMRDEIEEIENAVKEVSSTIH